LRPLQRLAWYWLPVVFWAGLIFAFSAQSNLRFAQADSLDFVVRKAGHMLVFGVLSVLLWRALVSAGVGRAIVSSWVLTVAYAASDEFHQSFTQGRHPSPLDVAIDATGALVALCLLVIWIRGSRRRSPSAPDR
jgi:VanZ family protein